MWPFKNRKKEETEVQKPKKTWVDIEHINLKMKIKSLVMFEQLAGHSYSKLSEADTVILMYCVFVNSTGKQIDFETFGVLAENEKFIKKMTAELLRVQNFFEQFKAKKADSQNEEKSGYTTEFSITEMVDKLIFQYGVDVNYVMNEMELWELEHFFEGAQEQYHYKMEEQRLWTFLQVAPHIDMKKVRSPEKFLPFHWEKEANRARSEKNLAAETARANNTIGMSIKL